MRAFALAALAAMALAGSASAADQAQNGWLTLKDKTSKDHLIFDGAVWKCKVDVCRSAKVKAVPADRACRQLAGKLGELTGFGYRGEDFTPEALAACNSGAKGA
ncbi:MAG: hypothetical protein V4466_01545 [Pseudomonadota bacterium]